MYRTAGQDCWLLEREWTTDLSIKTNLEEQELAFLWLCPMGESWDSLGNGIVREGTWDAMPTQY